MKPLLLALAVVLQAGVAPVETIANDMMSHVDVPKQAVARDAAEWAALWRQHAGAEALPAIDFTKRTVVAVFLGTRSTAGYAVQITGTRTERGRMIVQWAERRPGRDDVTAQIITSPAHLASIPKFAGEITFEKVDP